jgi:hypothetical protein
VVLNRAIRTARIDSRLDWEPQQMPIGRRPSVTEEQRRAIISLGRRGLGAKRIVALRVPKLQGLRYGVIYRVLKRSDIYNHIHSEQVRRGREEAEKRHQEIADSIRKNTRLTDSEIAAMLGIHSWDTISRIRARISSKAQLAAYQRFVEQKRRQTHTATLNAKRLAVFLTLWWTKLKLKAEHYSCPVHQCAMCKRKWFRSPEFFSFRKGIIMNWCKACERMKGKLKYQGYRSAALHKAFQTEIWIESACTSKALEEQIESAFVEAADCVPDHLRNTLQFCQCGCGRLWPQHGAYFHTVTEDEFTALLPYSLACCVPAVENSPLQRRQLAQKRRASVGKRGSRPTTGSTKVIKNPQPRPAP